MLTRGAGTPFDATNPYSCSMLCGSFPAVDRSDGNQLVMIVFESDGMPLGVQAMDDGLSPAHSADVHACCSLYRYSGLLARPTVRVGSTREQYERH
jgi:hypothetical protein